MTEDEMPRWKNVTVYEDVRWGSERTYDIGDLVAKVPEAFRPDCVMRVEYDGECMKVDVSYEREFTDEEDAIEEQQRVALIKAEARRRADAEKVEAATARQLEIIERETLARLKAKYEA